MALATRLTNILKDDRNFNSAVEVVRKISSGRIWLIGGAVYKTIIADLQGEKHQIKDYDFIVESIKNPRAKVKGFKSLKTFFGNPRFKNGYGLLIDVIPLENIIAVKELGLRPLIRNYLKQVPLSVQSVVYDVRSKRLYGAGVKDIEKRVVRVHNKEWYAKCVKKSADRYDLNINAKKLGLKAIE